VTLAPSTSPASPSPQPLVGFFKIQFFIESSHRKLTPGGQRQKDSALSGAGSDGMRPSFDVGLLSRPGSISSLLQTTLGPSIPDEASRSVASKLSFEKGSSAASRGRTADSAAALKVARTISRMGAENRARKRFLAHRISANKFFSSLQSDASSNTSEKRASAFCIVLPGNRVSPSYTSGVYPVGPETPSGVTIISPERDRFASQSDASQLRTRADGALPITPFIGAQTAGPPDSAIMTSVRDNFAPEPSPMCGQRFVVAKGADFAVPGRPRLRHKHQTNTVKKILGMIKGAGAASRKAGPGPMLSSPYVAAAAGTSDFHFSAPGEKPRTSWGGGITSHAEMFKGYDGLDGPKFEFSTPDPLPLGTAGAFGTQAPSSVSFGAPAPSSFSSGAQALSSFSSGAQAPSKFSFGAPAPSSFSSGAPAPSSFSFGAPAPSSFSSGAPAPSSFSFGAPAPSSFSFGAQTPSSFSSGAPAPSSFSCGAQTPSSFSSGAQAPSSFSSGAQTPSSFSFGAQVPQTSSARRFEWSEPEPPVWR